VCVGGGGGGGGGGVYIHSISRNFFHLHFILSVT